MFRLVENARSQGSAKNNLLLIVLVVALLAGGAGFFGGMKYQESKMPSRTDFQARMGMRRRLLALLKSRLSMPSHPNILPVLRLWPEEITPTLKFMVLPRNTLK